MDDDGLIQFADATDWLYDAKSEMAGKTDAELATMAEQYIADAVADGNRLNGDVLAIITNWRNEAATVSR